MTKGNSLGSLVEPTSTMKKNFVTQKDIEITVNPKGVDRIKANSSSIACCLITTVLVGIGVGIAIWYAVTEV